MYRYTDTPLSKSAVIKRAQMLYKYLRPFVLYAVEFLRDLDQWHTEAFQEDGLCIAGTVLGGRLCMQIAAVAL